MTDIPSPPAGEQVIVPPGHGWCIDGPAAAGTLSHIPQRHYIIILSLSAGAIKNEFFIRESAPKHVHLIFPASVCATLRWGRRRCVSHTDSGVEKFYEQWQVFFGYYDAVFFIMGR